MSPATDKRPGVDAGWRGQFPFSADWPRATQAGRSGSVAVLSRSKAMLRKKIIGLLLAASVVWGLLCGITHLVFFDNLPSAPNKSTERTYRLVVDHGAVRYGTEREARAQEVLHDGFFVAVFIFIATLAFGLRTGVLRLRSNTPAWGSKNET
jgi:hypothetical protein